MARARAETSLTLIRGGRITGQVVDSETNKPMSGVTVGVYSPAHPQNPGAVQTTITDAKGEYALRAPGGGEYVYVTGAPEGYFNCDAQEPTLEDGHWIEVNFALSPNHDKSLNGTVLDPSGDTVAGASVLCTDPDEGGPSGFTAVSDANGHFHFDHVRPNAEIRARWKDTATEKATKAPPPGQYVTLEVTPDGQFTLNVEVTDADGKPIPTASVRLDTSYGRFGEGTNPRAVAADGSTSFAPIFADRHCSIAADAPGYGPASAEVTAPARGGPHRQLLKIVLPKATSHISGVVLDDKNVPQPHVIVDMDRNNIAGARQTTTDDQGRFQFAAVPGTESRISIRPSYPGSFPPDEKKAKAGRGDVVLHRPSQK